jgi:sigma-B regulation protein RsbU (phosphoserine phosphatase)
MPFLEVGMIILALIFFQPVLTQVDELVRRMIVKDRTDLRQALEEYSRKIVSVFNLEKLKQMTFETIDTYLGVPKTVLVTRDKPEQSAQVHSNRGIQLVDCKEDALWEALEERNSPLFVDDWEKQSPLFEKLKEEDVHLLLPLNSQEELSGILGIGKKESRFGFSYDDISFLKVLANQLVIAISNVGLYQEALEKQIMEEELSLARQIQLELLPRSIPRHSSFELAGFIQPSRQVGGDYYDLVWDGSETLGMAIADTVGKGMPAALLVSILHATLRAEMKSKNAPAPALANLNQILCSATRPGHFATLFYGIFLPQTAELVYCNAGHNYPMLVRSNGELCNLDKGGLILGAFPDAIYQEGRVKVQPNDVLIMYTDGLSEAQNDTEEEFGEKRILDLVIKHRALPAQKIIDEILMSVNFYAPKPQDDLTMVVAKIL